jgi:putative PIN family toxin of toxin-antitoxin system
MMRTVLDTSFLVRYLIKPSAAIRELIEVRWLGGQVQMVTSPDLIEELKGVLKRDYIQALVRPEEGQAMLDAIYQRAEVLPAPGQVLSYTRDPKDDKFVACALTARADYVVTEDKDILVLGALGGGRMVTPYEFVRTNPK